MNISLSWLRDYIQTSLSLQELINRLTEAGIEVASYRSAGLQATKVVVGKVLSLEPHPNADRLRICQVDDGSGTLRQVVCGAANVEEGKHFPLALPGAILPNGTKIQVGVLRGVESQGMLCGGDEIGLAGEPKKGLLLLDEKESPGTPLEQLFPQDTILELEVTPNRSDWLGHLGVARTLAAFEAGEMKPLIWEQADRVALMANSILGEKKEKEAQDCDASTPIEIKLEIPEKVPFYNLAHLPSVKVDLTPFWLAQRLESVGLRSINHIVDICNYVMMATGEPLHAFDADKIEGPLEIRFARAGEQLLGLNDQLYSLSSEDIVIADARGPQALAGIIGGKESGVRSSTTAILIEGAVFHPGSIRRTARRHQLSTDASYRFERGSYPLMAYDALTLALTMLEQAGAVKKEESLHLPNQSKINCHRTTLGNIPTAREITFPQQRASELLGIDLSEKNIAKLLERLGASYHEGKWQIPPWRLDLERPVDLIEEIAHLIGMDQIPARSEASIISMSQADHRYGQRLLLKRQMIALGFFETITPTLVTANEQEKRLPRFRVRNPLLQHQEALRSSFSEGLFAVLKKNRYHGAECVKIFELGKLFGTPPWKDGDHDYEEFWGLAMLLSGEAAPCSWRNELERKLDFYDAKGVINLIAGESITYHLWEEDLPSWLIRGVRISLGDILLGYVGIVHPLLMRELAPKGSQDPILIAEMDLSYWRHMTTFSKSSSSKIDLFPSIKRDFAFLLPEQMPYELLERFFKEAQEPLLKKVQPFDVLEKLLDHPEKKSIALSLTFQAADRTLTSEEVDKICRRLLNQLEEKLGVCLKHDFVN